jgi:hypothetical protein
MGTVSSGFLPLPGDASLWIEISPGIEINRIMDVALKAAVVRPAVQIVERLYGLLEVHSSNQGETKTAGAAILGALGVDRRDCLKPRILSSQIIRNIDAHHAQLINRARPQLWAALSWWRRAGYHGRGRGSDRGSRKLYWSEFMT